MFLTLSNSGGPPVWSVRVKLDWNLHTWSVEPNQPAWAKICSTTRGAFETKSSGVIWLWDQLSGQQKRNCVILWDAPTGTQDSTHKAGGGKLFDPKDATLKDTTIGWSAGTALSSIREEALKHIREQFPAFPTTMPPPNGVEQTKRPVLPPRAPGDPPRATGCGGLPWWLFQKLGTDKFPKDRVPTAYTETDQTTKKPVAKSTILHMHGPTIGYKQVTQAVEKRRGTPGEIFIVYKPGETRRPLPGDIYILKTGDRNFRHVGIVIDATGEKWRTADGGQGATGYGICYRDIKFEPASAKMQGETSTDITYLDGWIDLEKLVEKSG